MTNLDKARERLHQRTLAATTLAEVQTAIQDLRDWLAAHPEDEWLRDGFEQLYLMLDIAEAQERIAEATIPLPISATKR